MTTTLSTGLYYITDTRDGKVWTWSGTEFRPAEKHAAKGYRHENTAVNQMHRLYQSGYAVGVPAVKRG